LKNYTQTKSVGDDFLCATLSHLCEASERSFIQFLAEQRDAFGTADYIVCFDKK
jgi:hypothetical protein